MIRLFASIVVRALVELALVLFIFAGVFFLVAFRTARRFATTTPDALDRFAGPLATALGLAASRSGRSAGRELVELDDGVIELDEIDGLTDEEREQSVDFWRSVIV